MPQRANIDTHKPNGTQPNQNFENFLDKIKNQTLISKIPKFWKPKLISAKSKIEMKKMFKKTYLEVDFAENKLENDGILSERQFWVERGSRKARSGK